MDAREQDPIRNHRRQWRDCLFVYPVISRRAKGLSIGVNLNPDKRCNFACVYCQIDRHVRRNLTEVDLHVLRDELRLALQEAAGGRLWNEPPFCAAAANQRRINDIAFSGDGEPTALANFDQAVAIAAEVRAELAPTETKLVVITNATLLDQPQVARALPILEQNNGELWAKIDAGTEGFFRAVNRPCGELTLERIVGNITLVARRLPVVIQTLFFRQAGLGPPADEIQAYGERLKEILALGGTIKLVQLHTIARPPAVKTVAALTKPELDAIAATLRAALPDTPVEVF